MDTTVYDPTDESHGAHCPDDSSEGNVRDIVVADAVSSYTTADGDYLSAEKCTESLDPYSYVQRGDYTSEVYKLELMNLPKRFGIAVSKFFTFYIITILQIYSLQLHAVISYSARSR